MPSRFVAAGPGQDLAPGDDGWSKARQEVELARVSKPEAGGKQEDGRSLYEVLQANKAAKQEAFEESARLRNQFRSLDDSETAFLESVHENERTKDIAARQETAERLEAFRKQRAAVEQAALQAAQAENVTAGSPNALTAEAWAVSKKRRRVENAGEGIPIAKQRKASTGKHEEPILSSVPESVVQAKFHIEADDERLLVLEQSSRKSTMNSVPTTALGLGLDAYGSSDEDG